MKLAVLTQGLNVPSTRFRVAQYLEIFQSHNIDVSFYHAKNSSYPPSMPAARIAWLSKELLHRWFQVAEINRSDVDVVILQRELISTLPTLEFLVRKPVIFDVDDAIFLHRKGWAAKCISRQAAHIVCGNDYLSAFFSSYNSNLTNIPTPVDTNRFVPGVASMRCNYIGWTGSSSGFNFLYQIEKQLLEVVKRFPDWKVLIVSDQRPHFKLLSEEHFDFEQWHPDNEVSTIQKMKIGLMPLSDDPWSRGKCSYKMLLYMACEVPCVVSNVGMNRAILNKSEVGIGVDIASDWVSAISSLVLDSELCQQMGEAGRQLVLREYSVSSAGAKWLGVLEQVMQRSGLNG